MQMRPSQLMEGEDLDRPLDTPLAKPSLQPRPQHVICGYCLKPSIYSAITEKFMNYVVYESGYHLKSDCPFKKTENTAPI